MAQPNESGESDSKPKPVVISLRVGEGCDIGGAEIYVRDIIRGKARLAIYPAKPRISLIGKVPRNAKPLTPPADPT